VIKRIYELIAGDEARHAGAYLQYMKQAMQDNSHSARAAFTKVGIFMAGGARLGTPLHPTNLHVNKNLFPRDTVQSRLPDPDALTRWLETQINFDAEWEGRVSALILKNLSLLFGEKFQTLRDLNKYRTFVKTGGV
jgi:hypothetical protein